MTKSYKTSELYVAVYVLAILGARYLGLDFHGLDPETVQHANQAVQQVADAYRASAQPDGGLIAAMGGLWVCARTFLKVLEERK